MKRQSRKSFCLTLRVDDVVKGRARRTPPPSASAAGRRQSRGCGPCLQPPIWHNNTPSKVHQLARNVEQHEGHATLVSCPAAWTARRGAAMATLSASEGKWVKMMSKSLYRDRSHGSTSSGRRTTMGEKKLKYKTTSADGTAVMLYRGANGGMGGMGNGAWGGGGRGE